MHMDGNIFETTFQCNWNCFNWKYVVEVMMKSFKLRMTEEHRRFGIAKSVTANLGFQTSNVSWTQQWELTVWEEKSATDADSRCCLILDRLCVVFKFWLGFLHIYIRGFSLSCFHIFLITIGIVLHSSFIF